MLQPKFDPCFVYKKKLIKDHEIRLMGASRRRHEPLHWGAKRDPKAKCFSCSPFYGRACMSRNYNLKDLKGHEAGLCCGSRLRKGEVFAYVGLPPNLKGRGFAEGLMVTDY